MNKHFNNNFIEDIDIPIKAGMFPGGVKILKKNNSNNKRRKKVKKKKKLILLFILNVILLYSLITSSIKIYNWHKDNKNSNKITEEINEVTTPLEIDEEGEEIELINNENNLPESDYWYYIKFPLIEVDFNELIKKNNETVAWIKVNNTNINYPIVQTSDNSYYLTRSYDKSKNEAGWVFMDYRNNKDFNNKNTIIYAHSRLDKTMFGSLSKVLKSSWYKNKDNHIINISTPSENSLWQIFSVYKIEAENYYITTNFENENTYLEFLDTIKKRSLYNFDVSLNKDDNILTLSTCYSDTERTVVHAKKIKKLVRN